MSTATGSLRNHLINCHYDEWISECKRCNIPINSTAGVKAGAGDKDSKAQTSSCPSYSPELFISALVDFIAATDQVFFSFF